MIRKKISRRSFLQQSSAAVTAAATAPLWLGTGCSSIDKSFIGDKRFYDDEVVILGGGLAGLTAAFELKKKNIPYRVFELMDKPGGRIRSLKNRESLGTDAFELGAEFLTSEHTFLRKLCQELDISIQPVPATGLSTPSHYFFNTNNDKFFSEKDLKAKSKSLTYLLSQVSSDLFKDLPTNVDSTNKHLYPRIDFYDQMPLSQFFEILKNEVDQDLLSWLEQQSTVKYGCRAQDLSALHFLSQMNLEKFQFNLEVKDLYSIKEGSFTLIERLYERISGFLEDYYIKLNHELLSIREYGSRFELNFKSASGHESYYARKVICTLPLSKLQQVTDVQSVFNENGIASWIKNAKYGQASKSVFGLSASSKKEA
ncbi:MAG: flavin monoamine oxidase family protein, partial [Pseudobdellovibrionaceae bacterium]